MVTKDSNVTIFKLGRSFMHPVRTCCTRTTIQTWPIFLPKKCIYTAREVWPATGEFVVIIHVL